MIEDAYVCINGNLLRAKDKAAVGDRPCYVCQGMIKFGRVIPSKLCRYAGLNMPGHIGILPEELKKKFKKKQNRP
jgi:hypothetical protein